MENKRDAKCVDAIPGSWRLLNCSAWCSYHRSASLPAGGFVRTATLPPRVPIQEPCCEQNDAYSTPKERVGSNFLWITGPVSCE